MVCGHPPRSPETFLQWLGVELSQIARNALYIPPGCAHGFVTLEDDCEIFYMIGEVYVPELARGVRWNDPAFGIAWPHASDTSCRTRCRLSRLPAMSGPMPKDLIPVFKPLLLKDEFEAAREALELGWLGMGAYVGEFERALEEFIAAGNRHVVAVSTGHAALHLSMLLAGVGPGDEVIVPSFNNIADFQAILATGAAPVLCDIDNTTLCIDVDKAEGLCRREPARSSSWITIVFFVITTASPNFPAATACASFMMQPIRSAQSTKAG